MAQEADNEKVTVNMVPVDLGKIDLLVGQGLYSSRTDLIRTAVRKLLDEHDATVQAAVARESFAVGVVVYDRAWLERQAVPVRLQVLGMLRFAKDVTPEVADKVIEHVSIRGALRGPQPVLDRLAAKTDRGVRISRSE